jgi:hypothetical protein
MTKRLIEPDRQAPELCKNGHRLSEVGFTWQWGGHGGRSPYVLCRKCNSERAKQWRAATGRHR